MTSYFDSIDPIRYEGPGTANPLAYRWYDADWVVMDKTMKEQLRFAVCYWHNFCWNGFDPFSHSGTLERPWWAIHDPMASAKAKADDAFAFMSRFVEQRYASWSAGWAQDVLAGRSTLDAVAPHAWHRNIDQPPVSGRQEFLENWCNRFVG